MIAADHELRDTATAHADSVLKLVDTLRATNSIRWEPPIAEEMTTVSGVLDPAGAAATARTGLALRARYREAMRELQRATATFHRLSDEIDRALTLHSDPYARWNAEKHQRP